MLWSSVEVFLLTVNLQQQINRVQLIFTVFTRTQQGSGKLGMCGGSTLDGEVG